MKSTEACRRGTHNDRGIRKARDDKWGGAKPIDVVRIRYSGLSEVRQDKQRTRTASTSMFVGLKMADARLDQTKSHPNIATDHAAFRRLQRINRPCRRPQNLVRSRQARKLDMLIRSKQAGHATKHFDWATTS